jgi:thiamine kinase-like enzyme
MELEEQKKRVALLNDADFIKECLNQNLAKYYSDFVEVQKLELHAYKKHLGKSSAVFVVAYKLEYLSHDDTSKKLKLVATGHSDGSRKAAFAKLNYLYQHGFDSGKYLVTKPLFYLEENLAFVYEASIGHRLFSLFKADEYLDLANAMSLTTAWVKKLHQLEIDETFVWPNFSVRHIGPSIKKFFTDIISHNEILGKRVEKMLADIQNYEELFSQSLEPCLVYGDYHPENVILTSLEAKQIKMIDFTDVALGDPMLDIGSFLQQLDFMGHRFFSRAKVNYEKEHFLIRYFDQKFEEIPLEFFPRINLYQAWVALRTATFLFYMNKDDSVKFLLDEVDKYLALVKSGERKINLY